MHLSGPIDIEYRLLMDLYCVACSRVFFGYIGYTYSPDSKRYPRETSVSGFIMVDQLRALLKLLNTKGISRSEGFQGAQNRAHMMPRESSLHFFWCFFFYSGRTMKHFGWFFPPKKEIRASFVFFFLRRNFLFLVRKN